MFIPTKDVVCEMTPTEFERYSLEVFQRKYAGVDNLEFKHNVLFETPDGDYQIDGTITFELMGLTYTVLIECKHYRNPISREKVQILYDKIRAVGAHKGVIVSTSNFQSGAIKYATQHGIALIQLTETSETYHTRGLYNEASNSLAFKEHGYIGVMQIAKEDSVECKYLHPYTSYFEEFLLYG